MPDPITITEAAEHQAAFDAVASGDATAEQYQTVADVSEALLAYVEPLRRRARSYHDGLYLLRQAGKAARQQEVLDVLNSPKPVQEPPPVEPSPEPGEIEAEGDK